MYVSIHMCIIYTCMCIYIYIYIHKYRVDHR